VSTSFRFGPFVVDRPGYRLLHDDRSVPISPKLLDVLFYLLEHAGDLVTKEALLDAVWPDANVSDNALTQAVSELRQILGDDPSSPRYIKTVARRGYRFIDAVSAIDAGVPQAVPAMASSGPLRGSGSIRAATDAGATASAIAVLDFVNVTGDPETAWLCAGIAETVTGDLRSLGDFRIVDRRRVLEATAVAGSSLMSSVSSRSHPDVNARYASMLVVSRAPMREPDAC
jgi:DNA-binding winged helix-turn-helix (wHTH) protein